MVANQSFGAIAKNYRRELGLTQGELARRVGCAPITLRKIEADDLRPSVQIAERMAMALNIPLEEPRGFRQTGANGTCHSGRTKDYAHARAGRDRQ